MFVYNMRTSNWEQNPPSVYRLILDIVKLAGLPKDLLARLPPIATASQFHFEKIDASISLNT